MMTSNDVAGSDSMPLGRALRLGAAVLSGPLVVLPLMKFQLIPDEFLSGPLWLNAEILTEELVHTYSLTLMVAISLFAYRLLVPERPVTERVVCLPVLLWGFESAIGAYRAFFGPGHWQPGFLLFLTWLIGVVTFLGLGLVFLLALPGLVRVEEGRRGRRVARMSLRSLALAAVVVTTVVVDWVLVSTQASELRIVPALERAAAIDEGG